jgi:hypothetical protein
MKKADKHVIEAKKLSAKRVRGMAVQTGLRAGTFELKAAG